MDVYPGNKIRDVTLMPRLRNEGGVFLPESGLALQTKFFDDKLSTTLFAQTTDGIQTLPPEIKTENAHFLVRKIQLDPNAEDGYVSESERFPSQVTYDISEFLLNGAVSQKNHLRLITDLILQSAPHGDNIFRHKFAGYLMNRQASIDAFSIITPEPGVRDELAAFILHKRQQAFLINIADAPANAGHLTTRIEDLEDEIRVKTSLYQLGIKTLTILNPDTFRILNILYFSFSI